MRIKVVNVSSEDYEREFKLRRMNYDQIIVNYPSNEGMKVFKKEEVQFITESEIDEFLIKYSDFLKIKLNRGISILLYKAILDALESELEIKFQSLNLLKDKYSINKRGIWEKEIVCLINDIIPIKIIANGQNFKKIGFNIVIEKLSKEYFFDFCSFEIKKIKKEIKEKEDVLYRYDMSIKAIKEEKNIVKMPF